MKARASRFFREKIILVSENGSKTLAKRFLLRLAPLAIPLILPNSRL
jgi:hypothetical protein